MTGLAPFLAENPILTLLLICHFLSDFQLQSQKTADFKNKDYHYLLRHFLGVALPLSLVGIMIPGLIPIILFIFLSHVLIDYYKVKLAKVLHLSAAGSFAVDQGMHLIITISLALTASDHILPAYLDRLPLTSLLFLVLITKPSNIAFKIFFDRFQPKQDTKMDSIPGAGAMIGNLERIVIGICMLMGQFASIGLVFTAKSIARYDRISKDAIFAEYYLIGSLFSILTVFLAAFICFY
ncbi:DUF3307 domain-containing protein [Streptococcus catagoni]|uniref:DUF3307 domain-containing protein n=1 Tax=Streptococcus catagoni TaxID=2654874 RepID=UPI00140E67F8|nr:DUF3307 domain-containing protein [Streptococcus catagoni]